MASPLDQVQGARIPRTALAALAGLRRERGVTVVQPAADAGADADRVWVRWAPAGAGPVLRVVLTLPGVELFERREGRWYRLGRRLPAFDLPKDPPSETGGPAVALSRALVPAPVQALDPDEAASVPSRLRLVRDDRVREATGLRCTLAELERWAESATSSRLAALQMTVLGEEVMVAGRGRLLPTLVGGSRFWGDRVWLPLGHRAEPDLPAEALRDALGVADDERLVLDTRRREVVPFEAFAPMSRASIRLAAEERATAREARP